MSKFGRIVDLTASFDAPQFLMAGVLLAGALLWTKVDVTQTVDPTSATKLTF